MCNYAAPKQFAYVDPAGKFQRLKTLITSEKEMKACMSAIPHKAAYESVYGWVGWDGGKLTPRRSKHAIINGLFLDFDNADDPQKAIRDAAEVAAYVGHCIGNFSGAKGAHLWITCHPVDLIPDLKGHVIRQFVNNLVDVLPELDTLDFAVVGDTSRVRRIIDSVHPKTKMHAIGLTAYELATLTIDEIHEMAANRRGLIQIPEPSLWVSRELYRIEDKIILERLDRLFYGKKISYTWMMGILKRWSSEVFAERLNAWNQIRVLEDEWHRIRAEQQVDMRGSVIRGKRIGATKEETWLIHAVREFKATGRAATGSRKSEHKERVHIVKLADECRWTYSEICDIFTGADDYNPAITECMINSLIRRG